MKKNILFTLAVIAIISFSAKIFAHPPDFADEPAYTAKRLNTDAAITIDASVKDEAWTESDEASSLGYDYNGTTLGVTENDCSFKWKAAWDDEKLYLLITVKDDVVLKRYADYQPDEIEPWYSDNIELYFNPTGQRQADGEDTYALTNASQHRLVVGTEIEAYEITCDQSYINMNIDETYYYEIDYPGTGYIAEIWYTWDAILPDEMEIPDRIGFTINVGDADDITTKRDVIAMWAGAGLHDNQWLSVNYFGVLNLSGYSPPPPKYYSDILFLVNNDGIITAAPSLLNFGDVKVGRKKSLTIKIENQGEATLDATFNVSGTGFNVDKDSISVEPGHSDLIEVIFIPDQINNYLGILTISSNDPDEEVIQIDLYGEASQTVNVAQELANSTRIYPNPANDFITIEAPLNDEMYFEIFDVLGKKHMSGNFRNDHKIDISGLKRGSYFVKIIGDDYSISRLIVIN